MSILAKIYVDKNKLYLENCGVWQTGKNYPSGKRPDGGFSIGSVVIGKDNIAISNEAIDMFRHIVRYAEHTGDDVSCLDIHENYSGEIVVSWLGKNKMTINPNRLDDGFFIGCGEGAPRTDLLDKLTIMDNETLKNYKFEANEKNEGMQK